MSAGAGSRPEAEPGAREGAGPGAKKAPRPQPGAISGAGGDAGAGLDERFGYRSGCLFIKDMGICAVSDLHIGLEDTLRRQGLAFPMKEEMLLRKRLKGALDRFHPATFVLAGDIFHSFSRLDRKVRDEFDSIMTFLEARCDVVLLRGSHDTMLQAAGREALDRYDAGGITFAHGHEAIEGYGTLEGHGTPEGHRVLEGSGTLVMGHEHPVIQIDMERLPCFLHGSGVINGRDLVLLPAFNPLCQGVTINHVEGRDFLSPMLRRIDTGDLSPVIEVEGEVLFFPRLRGLRKHID